MNRLDGKIVLVTGGAKGQGPMHARLCAREGADVILVDILDEAGEATAESIRGEGHKARYFHLDITRADDWREVLDTVAAEHGPVNGLGQQCRGPRAQADRGDRRGRVGSDP